MSGTNLKHEPVLFLDATGSQNYPISDRDSTPRWQVLMEAVKTFVAKLSEADSAAADNQEEGGGGILTYAFQSKNVRELGDLNPGNFSKAVSVLRPGGTTFIMPAIAQWQADRDEEFSADEQNDMSREYDLLVATDGALEDEQQFVTWVTSSAPNIKVYFLLIGQGDDNRDALQDYNRLATANPGKVTIYNMQGHADPTLLAKTMLTAIS